MKAIDTFKIDIFVQVYFHEKLPNLITMQLRLIVFPNRFAVSSGARAELLLER